MNEMTVKESIEVQGVMVRRLGEHVLVEVEVDGKWYQVIQEPIDSNFSHIIEPGGIRSIVNGSRTTPY